MSTTALGLVSLAFLLVPDTGVRSSRTEKLGRPLSLDDDVAAVEAGETVPDGTWGNHGDHLRRFAAWAPTYAGFVQMVEANRNRTTAGFMEKSQDPRAWPDDWKLNVSSAKQVGKGAFGTVYTAPLKSDPGLNLAVKEQAVTAVNKEDRWRQWTALKQEAEMMKKFCAQSPYFVKIFGTQPANLEEVTQENIEIGQSLNIMMEGATCDLQQEIEELKRFKTSELPNKTARVIALMNQTLLGVAAMHTAKYIHRDLKPANILIVDGEAKVADLGLSCSHDPNEIAVCEGIGGSPLFMAPETARLQRREADYEDGVHEKNDVWALGLILYELRFGADPVQLGNQQTSLESLWPKIRDFKIRSDMQWKNSEPRSWGSGKSGDRPKEIEAIKKALPGLALAQDGPSAAIKFLLDGMLENDKDQRLTSQEALTAFFPKRTDVAKVLSTFAR